MELQTLNYQNEHPVAVINLNRPPQMNALNSQMLSELDLVLDTIAGEESIRAVIITGGDKAFAAGADIKEIINIVRPAEALAFSIRAQSVITKIERLDKPVIAAVAGLAFGGGCEMALACDIRVAAENASFALPEIKLGLLPGGGGTQRLPRLVGAGKAKEMMFSGEPVDAQEAYRIGLVNKVVTTSSLMEESKKMASVFCERPGYALMTIKHLVNTGMSIEINEALAIEARSFALLFSTDDHQEGLNAFVEKRKPEFKHR